MAALDPAEFGRRVSAARGYVQELRPAFGDRFSVSDSTIERWEKGNIGQRTQKALADDIVEKTGCPAFFFSESDEPEAADPIDERLRSLETQVRAVVQAQGRMEREARQRTRTAGSGAQGGADSG